LRFQAVHSFSYMLNSFLNWKREVPVESICDKTAVELVKLLKTKAISPVALLDAVLARIEAVNPAVNAVVTLDEPGARAAAKAAEAELVRGDDKGPAARPAGADQGHPGYRRDALHLWQPDPGRQRAGGRPGLGRARLRAAGAIIFGKTNTPEWAAGGNTRNPVFGATGNPFDPMRSAAGSSGGSAVALACGMAPLASGSDTGGSLRNPAGFSGIVGMRPSYGLVASDKRAHGWSCLSTDGPMARDVADTALMLSVMASDDTRDPLAYTLAGRGRARRAVALGGAAGRRTRQAPARLHRGFWLCTDGSTDPPRLPRPRVAHRAVVCRRQRRRSGLQRRRRDLCGAARVAVPDPARQEFSRAARTCWGRTCAPMSRKA
jgi:hypothetical protein